ncbi:MAG: DNA polymerase Y family protein, partial [Lysobacterales bacterium]
QSRFGAELSAHLERLLGDRPDPLRHYQPPDRFDAGIELGHESVSSQALLFPLRRLTADLAAFLAGRDGGVQRFTLELLHERAPATPVEVGLQSVQRDPAMLFELARSRLERATVTRPALGLRLLATELPAFIPAARDLFDGRPAHALPIPQLRERLRARLGADAVYQLALTTDPRPECAQALSAQTGGHELPERLPRPTWLLHRPIPLRGPAPRLLAGPERIETGWWDGGDIRRDYYVVETGQGQRAWVFCAPGQHGPWMLHGWFA